MEGRINRLESLNRLNNIMENMFFSLGSTTGYLTLLYGEQVGYTNYSSTGKALREYLSEYTPDKQKQISDNITWKGAESNYVDPEKSSLITLLKPIRGNVSTSDTGILFISVPETEFSSLIAGQSVAQTRIILDSSMRVVSSTDKGWLKLPFSQIFCGSLPDEKKGYVIDKLINGKKTIISYCRIPKTGWTVVDFTSFSEVTGELNNVRNRLLLLNIICIIVFFILASLLAGSITKPLRTLSKKMLKTDLRVEESSQPEGSSDEVKMLEASFQTMVKNINKLMEENISKERKKREAELKALQAQVNPHFLFNTLNTIRCAIVNKNYSNAAEMVPALSRLLRMTLTQKEELISLEQEIKTLQSYILIIKMMYNNLFDVFFDVDESMLDYRIPKLLLQPLIENAIIHGFEDTKSEGLIEVVGRFEQGKVVLIIKDNGKGTDENPLEKSDAYKGVNFSGIGVSNVDERIKLYYGTQYGLEFKSSRGVGTMVEIILPVLEKEAPDYV